MDKKSKTEQAPLGNPQDVIGKRIEKKSGKPFKSRLKINTVKGIAPHPVFPDRQAFTFEEDDSLVLVSMCQLANE